MDWKKKMILTLMGLASLPLTIAVTADSIICIPQLTGNYVKCIIDNLARQFGFNQAAQQQS